MVNSAYATVAGAYQELRTRRGRASTPTVPPAAVADGTGATPPAGVPTAAAPAGAIPPSTGAIPKTRTKTPTRPAPAPAGSADAPSVPSSSAPAMAPKALTYYRKAESCLNRGDLRGAVLQLKLACAQDPSSGFLRTALAEVEAEVRKAT
jgi:hypothetical protein